MKRLTSLAAVVALAAGVLAVPAPALASKTAPPKQAGVLHVYDGGSLFTKEGIDRAKGTFGDTKFDHGLMMTIDTHSVVPAGKTVPEAEGERAKFFEQWAKDLAKDDRAKGIYVLVCRSPGYVQILADKTTRDRGFNAANEQKLRDLFLTSFRAAKDKPEAEQFRLRDEALQSAVGYVISDLKDTTVAGGTTPSAANNNNSTTKKAGMSIGGWICLGLLILLCIWLVIGVIRALTGGGGYGGGGGFGTALLGGMFGAMAGMWLYNSMMGTHYGPENFGGDAYANDGSSGADTSGDGDFSGDAGAGGGYDDGGTGGGYDGGGDYGGGDYGGGGDFGGGGGDFGGGDF